MSASPAINSSKKKKLWTECASCSGILLSKDVERHKSTCNTDASASSLPIIQKRRLLRGLTQNLSMQMRDRLLPADAMGWARLNTVFVHPETLSQLGITARTPCILRSENRKEMFARNQKSVVVWPTDEISNMKILCTCDGKELLPDILVSLLPVVSTSQIRSISNLRLKFCSDSDGETVQKQQKKNSDGETVQKQRRIYENADFTEFASLYLCDAYLLPETTMAIRYFGQIYRFRMLTEEEPLAMLNDMERLSLANDPNRPIAKSQNDQEIFHVQSKTRVDVEREKKTLQSREKLTPSFDVIGGLAMVKVEINRFIINPLKDDNRGCAMLLWGMTGCGKSLVLEVVENYLRTIRNSVHICRIDQRKMGSVIGQLDSMSTGTIDLLIIDDLDQLIRSDAQFDNRLRSFMDRGIARALIAVVRSVDDVDLALRRRFDLELELVAPIEEERREILSILIKERNMDANEDIMADISKRTHGFTGSDLASLCDLVKLSMRNLSNSSEQLADSFESARLRIHPTGMRQFLLEVPNVKWTDIGGYEQLKREIQQAVIWPHEHPDAFNRLGISAPSGILLYGPPGCSKTLIARALATQSRLNFLSVKGPELFSKWVGESERAVRELFRRARQVAPTILFFDEIDAVGTARSNSGSGGGGGAAVSERVLAQLLTELDGLEKRCRVLVLAATNRPDVLDGALLRPGRLDRIVYVPLPDSDTRRSILDLNLNKMPLSDDVKMEDLIQSTAGYSGAELVAVCRSAAMAAMLDNMNASSVSWLHFVKALESVPPRTNEDSLTRYEAFKRGARNI